MARKKSKSNTRNMKPRNIEPAPQTLYFFNTMTAIDDLKYIDLSQVASLVNRRFYRQGLNWAVGGFKFLTSANFQGQVMVSKLPNTWVMSNAWEKSFRTWNEMVDKAVDDSELESVKPRFHDFKIYADADHHQAGSGANLLPRSLTTAAIAGDWDYSTIHVPQTSSAANPMQVLELDLIATGASYPGAGASGNNAVSLVEGYAASRALPNVLDPNTPDDARDTTGPSPENWLQAIFNEGLIQDSEVIRDLQTQNEIAPYPFENDGVNADTMYPGGANQLTGMQAHDVDFVTATTIGGRSHLKGGNFPCGLVRIDTAQTNFDPTSPGGWVLLVDLIPGYHRGYLAESMTEM